MKYGIAFMIIRLLLNEMHKYSIPYAVYFRHQLGGRSLSLPARAGTSTPARAALNS